MANNNDSNDPQRNPSRPEDNPFIAFRRYADSQVSSLLNTVFTLPAQIANYNNAHHAREQCLFGKADQRKCEELQALDEHTEKLRHEGAALYRAGDVQAVLKKSEQLMMLEHQAGELRREILSDADDSKRGLEQKDLIEKVGNKKGQLWSDSWDWPEPTRDEELDDNEFGKWLESRAKRAGGEIERMLTRLEEDASKMFGEEMSELRKHLAARNEEAKPQTWSRSWSWQWPPPADAVKQEQAKLLGDSYSPAALEADTRTRHMGSLWRNAFEDLMRTTQEHPLLSDAQNTYFDQIGLYALNDYHKQQMQLEQQNREPFLETRREQPQKLKALLQDTNDEPSYEYAHDHEDQHDDPPTPKPQQSEFPTSTALSSEARQPKTELDAYERLLEPWATASQSAVGSSSGSDKNLSILSTLTTTERTIAPDGTVTTKVILKKRFADGSEQSSETIHTQRGQDNHSSPEDLWKPMQNAQSVDASDPKSEKKRGWFWSN